MTLEDLGLNAARLIGGFAGGIAHVFTVRDFSTGVVAGSIIVGTLVANFLGPAAQHVAPSWVGDYGAAFIVGYFAILIMQGIEVLVRKYLSAHNGPGPKEPHS